MKKFITLCYLLCSVLISYTQSFGNLTGAMTGSSVTTAAANAAKQLQSMMTTSPTSGSMSQLQLLGLDPATVQKYIKAKADSAQRNQTDQSSPVQEALQTVLEMRVRQDSMQASMDRMYKQQNPNTDIKPNEIFGHDFFGTGQLALFLKSSDSKASDEYILGAGDEISIAVWGYADYNNKFKVNDDGFIQIPEFGRIYVKGLTFGAVKAQIGKRLATFINPSNTKYEITLNYSRTIDINIVGEVKAPGTYQIPAINSVYNAINAANGISEIGSVRDIQVRREGKVVKRFDVYEFLFNPMSQENFFLQKGDFIYVSTQSKLVKISGSVRRPAKYELLKGENLNEAIKFAGGFAPDAYTKSLQIIRKNNDKSQIIDVDYEQIANSNFDLKDGDEIKVSSIPGEINNAITISGPVRYPGRYELKDGYRVSDVIKIAGGIRLDTYLERAYIKRKLDNSTYVIQKFVLKNILEDENSSDNLLLKQNDQIQLFSKDDFIEKFSVSIDGSVLKPTIMEYTDGLSLNDLLFYAGGLKKEAANSKIEISRVLMNKSGAPEDNNATAQRVIVKTISIGADLEVDDKSKAFLLTPMDRVYVRKEYGFEDQSTITLTGEVKYPGIYPILRKDEKVLDVIERAGGLTPYAFVRNARLTRPDSKLDKTIFQLKDAFADSTSRANLILKNGDVIDIPTVNQLVSIKGAVRYPGLDSLETINGKFVPGKKARWYIKHYAGGFKKGALRKSTMVIYPNRKVEYTHSFIGIKNYPTVDNEGALITVDMKQKTPKPPKGPESRLNWNIVLPSVIAALTSIASTITLISVLKK
jgi:protein involved in polysaccharide export with SLBB domain